MEKVLAEYEMSAGPNSVWSGDPPYVRITQEVLDGGEVYVVRSPWAERAYENWKMAERAAKKIANGN